MARFRENEADSFLMGDHFSISSKKQAAMLGSGADLGLLGDHEETSPHNDSESKESKLFKAGDRARLDPSKNPSLFRAHKFRPEEIFEVTDIELNSSGNQVLVVRRVEGSKEPYHLLAKKFIKV